MDDVRALANASDPRMNSGPPTAPDAADAGRIRDRTVGASVRAAVLGAAGPVARGVGHPWTVAVLIWTAVIVLLRATVPWGFMSIDDASFMAVYAALDGGEADPRVGFQHVVLGRMLVALSEWFPSLPWYGIVLHASQAVALLVLTVAVLRLARRASRAASIATLLTLVAVGATLIVALQFTAVAILAAVAAVLGAVAASVQRPLPSASAVSAVLLLVMASLIRPTGAVLGAGIGVVASIAAWPSIDGPRRSRLGATIVVGMVLVAGLTLLEDRVFAPDPVGTARMRADLYPPGSRLFAAQAESWAAVAERLDPDGLSDNDRWLVGRWVHPTPELLGVPDPGPWGPGVSTSEQAIDLLRQMVVTLGSPGPLLSATADIGRASPIVLAVLVTLVVAALFGGHRRASSATFTTAIGLGGLAALTASSRAPDWLVVPALIAVVAATHVAIAMSSDALDDATPAALRVPAGVIAVTLMTLGTIALGAGAVRVIVDGRELVVDRDARRADVAAIRAQVTDDEVVGLWTAGLWRLQDPLALRGGSVLPFATTPVAGGDVVLPYHRRRHDALRMSDWVGAVATRDDVLLLVGSKKLEALRTLLVERRGWSCPEPVVVVQVPSGDMLIRRFVEGESC